MFSVCVVLVYPSSSSPYALCIGVVQNAGHRGSGGSHFRSQGKVSQQYCWQINQLGADDCSPKQDGKKGKEEEEPTTNTTTTTTKLADCHNFSTLLIVPTTLLFFSLWDSGDLIRRQQKAEQQQHTVQDHQS